MNDTASGFGALINCMILSPLNKTDLTFQLTFCNKRHTLLYVYTNLYTYNVPTIYVLSTIYDLQCTPTCCMFIL